MTTIKRSRKMTQTDIRNIVEELTRWADGELGLKLTWEKVEKFSGFTKPALNAKLEIKQAFKKAKEALSVPNKVSTSRQNENQTIGLRQKINLLQIELDKYQKLENDWLAKWQRITYHLKAKGFSIEEVDMELPSISR